MALIQSLKFKSLCLNWTKVGLKVIVYRIVFKAFNSLNWTKVGLKDLSHLHMKEECLHRLNWTKVGLKVTSSRTR